MARLPNSGVKRFQTDVWLFFTVRNFSMITDVYISFSSEAEWSSVLDNTVQGWEVVLQFGKLDVSCHDVMQLFSVELKLQKHHNHISMYETSSFCSDLELTSWAKWCLIVWENKSIERLHYVRQCKAVSEVIVHVWCVVRLFLVQMCSLYE